MRRISWRLLFFTLNAIGLLILLARTGTFSSQKLTVLRTFPSADGVCLPQDVSEVTVEFGGLLDPRTVKADAIRLLPFVPGAVHLDGERFLRFQLSKKLAQATRYQVDVSSQVRGRGGERPQLSRFSFLTPSLAVKSVSQAKIEADRSSILAIEFSSAVNPQALVNSLELSDPLGHSVAFTPVGSRPDAEVRVRIPRNEWEEIRLTIKKGLTGTEGPLPLAADYHSTVKVAASLQFLGMRVEERTDSQGLPFTAIKVQMNSPIDVATAGQFITVEPAVTHTFDSAGDGLEICGEFKPAQRYTVTLKKGLSAGAAGALVEDITRSVWFPDASPNIRFLYGDGILSTLGLRTLPIRSVNVKSFNLAIYRLYANNLVEYALRESSERFGDFGTLVNRTEITPEYRKNQEVQTLLRMDQLVRGDVMGVYSLQIDGDDNRWDRDAAIMVVSDLGIWVHQGQDEILVWVTSLASGRPQSNCNVTLYSDRRQNLGMAITDADGVARIAVPPLPDKEKPALVTASRGNDLNYLSLSDNARDRGPETAEGRPYLKRGYEVFAFAERGIYRPGDTVHLCGYVRDGELLRPPPMPLNLIVKGPKGREVLRKTVMSDASGRLLVDIPIVYSSPSGQYEASWHLPSKEEPLGSAEFHVADYIPQTLRITVRAPEDGRQANGDQSVQVHGEQLFGGPAVGLTAKCTYRYRAEDAGPKGWDGFKFGDDRKKHEVGSLTSVDDGKLDEHGDATFTLKAPHVESPSAIRAEVQVEVLEAGGRAISEYMTHTLDSWPYYLGVKQPPAGIQSGQPQTVKLAAVLPDGAANKTVEDFTATLYRVTWSNVLRKQNGRLVYDWTRQETQEAAQEGKFSQGRAELTIQPKLPGPYRLVVESSLGCAVTTDFEAAGLGADWVSDDPERINVTLDKPAYRPGETARVHLRAPFAGTALLTLETNQILEHRLVRLANGEGIEAFNVREEWRPNVYVAATVVRPVQPEKDWRPHRAAGVARLKIDCTDRRLDLKVESPEQVRPGHKLDVAVQVLSAGQMQPGAAVTLVAVDEGVLALTKFLTPSPWEFFYPLRRLDIQEFDIYGRLAPELDEWRVGRKLQPGGGGGDDEAMNDLGRRLNPIQAHRVKTAVLFAGNLTADAQGVARASFAVPEYIGELRIMATAAQDNRFGSIQRALKVKSPIMAQASWPRFLAPDDQFQVPVTVFNRTDKEQTVKLNVTTQGPLQVVDALPVTVTVPAGADKLVRLAMKATGVGVITPRITAQAGEEQYTESVEIPVRPAVGFARKSAVVAIEAGKPQSITLAGQFLPGTVKTSVVIAGSRMVEFTDALQSLLAYPYGCVEQTTSKLVPLIYLSDLTRLADPQAIGKEEVGNLLASGFLQLEMMQTYSGGLATWPGQTEPYPWGSVYAADLLVEAQKAGYEVPKKLLSSLLEYITANLKEWATARQDYQPTQIGEATYACYVLARAGEAPYAWMSTLEETIRDCDTKKLAVPTTARFHLAAAYLTAGQAKAGRGLLAGSFPATTKRQIDSCLNSPLREAAIKLLVLLDIDPDLPQIPALVETLRQGVRSSSQLTTQEAAFTLMALGKYARRAAAPGEGDITVTLPDGSKKTFAAARGWHNEALKPGDVIQVSFQGKGKAYAFWNIEGVPAQGPVKEEDAGLAVRRSFFKIDGKTPVGNQAFKTGELYQVVLQVTASCTVDNLVLTDLLPAGLEIADLDMAGTGKFTRDANASLLSVRHSEPRDDRLIVFAQTNEGACDYRYIVRAVTAGEFVLPAAEASCMYDPGLYSVNGRGTVKVAPQ